MYRGAWWDTSPWGHKESDTTERLTLSFFTFYTISLGKFTVLWFSVLAIPHDSQIFISNSPPLNFRHIFWQRTSTEYIIF